MSSKEAVVVGKTSLILDGNETNRMVFADFLFMA